MPEGDGIRVVGDGVRGVALMVIVVIQGSFGSELVEEAEKDFG
jgi:hypothetical protein